MKELSLEMKKILVLVLPRVTTMDIRIMTDAKTYLPVLGEMKELQQTLEREILEEEAKKTN